MQTHQGMGFAASVSLGLYALPLVELEDHGLLVSSFPLTLTLFLLYCMIP